MIINGYSGEEGLQEAVTYSVDLLKRYADGSEIESWYPCNELSTDNLF